jgi:hypothetical protein
MSSQVAQRRQSGGNGYRGNNNHRNNRRDNGRYRQDYSTSRRHHESHNNNQAHEPVIPGAFFLGNIDKALTREEVYEFVKNETNCYIKKFDMPNVVGDEKDTQGRPIRCAGFAFVHVKYQWMADEMLSLGKIRIGNLEAEIKPYDQMKRLMSERRHRANTQNLSEHGGDDQVAPPASTTSPKKPSSSSRIVTPRETSSSSRTPHQRHQGYTGTENWAELEGESDYHPGNDWSMKISQFGDHCLEDDSQYQTEDDSASIASRRETNVNVIEPPSSMYSTRASTPSQRHQNRSRMVSKINVPENTIIVGEITQKLIDDGITPTADKINELAAEKYAVEGAIVGEQVSFCAGASKARVGALANTACACASRGAAANCLAAADASSGAATTHSSSCECRSDESLCVAAVLYQHNHRTTRTTAGSSADERAPAVLEQRHAQQYRRGCRPDGAGRRAGLSGRTLWRVGAAVAALLHDEPGSGASGPSE